MTAGVIAVALALPATLHLGLKSLNQLSGQWEVLGNISLFLNPELSSNEAATVAEEVSSRSDVKAVEQVSPDQALEEFSRLSGFNQALESLSSNPLPWVLLVQPSGSESADSNDVTLDRLADQLMQMPQVDFAQFDREWLNRFESMLRIGQRAALVIAGLLIFAVLLIVGNTIRLELQARQDEIEVSKLLGATDGFVRRPFLYLGLWYGALGGFLAVVLVGGVMLALGSSVSELSLAYQSDFRLVGPNVSEVIGLIGAGGAVGWLGSWLAAGRQLAIVNPD